MRRKRNIFLIHFLVYLSSSLAQLEDDDEIIRVYGGANACYDETGRPQRCVPEFVNAAFNRRVEVSNTCGVNRPTEYCVQTGHSGMTKTCDICDARAPHQQHPAAYLTDFNNPQAETWWASETMAEGIQHPNMVNLTLHLGKSFDITYVRLKFRSPRPESFAIYKKKQDADDWVPWQYYSATCRSTYGVPDKAPILPNAETVAQCTSEYSDISPLTGANVAYSTLEGRPSAQNFETSPVLQELVTATSIRVVLNRLNTFGDEVFRDEKVLRSYYYAIADFAIGGRCKCNGHASECVKSTGQGATERLVCRCEHNTMGEDCQQCLPFFNDRPWKGATAEDANECKPCNCSNLSSRCYFDADMHQRTGSGGHCIDCQGNTRGPHCEQCLENHWRRPGEYVCTACNCNEIGSLSLQCNDQGQCPCKPGVGGQYCDRCLSGFYEFSAQGCKDCGCVSAGSYNNQQNCRPDTGHCACKTNVEGQRCDRCKPGHFNLDIGNEFGCTPCFCHGHASVCDTAPGYYKANLTADFGRGPENWKAEAYGQRKVDVQYSERDRHIFVSEYGGPTFFLAPDKYLGNQRSSYNQFLTFRLRVIEQNARASVADIVLQGANGRSVSVPIFAQNNPPPGPYEQVYRYRLHEDPQFQWTPKMSSLDFMSILSNLTALKIRGTFSTGDVGFLDDVSVGSASTTPSVTEGGNGHAKWVESCTCPSEYVGQNCESCAPGFRREPRFGGSFARCVACQCNGHADICDSESGACICQHHTTGSNCERCADGYYGNALKGTADDCKPCPCPKGGRCTIVTGEPFCTECPAGYSGRYCDQCTDGYHGDPPNGVDCKPCDCSGNIDPNSVGNCHTVTGECTKCIYSTHGFRCEKCLPGFFGDALLDPKGDCKSCACYGPGTHKPTGGNYTILECEQSNGQCTCLPHVTGRQCDVCEAGYYNITSGSGCHSCNCDPLGSLNTTCDVITGQCLCKEGITGRRCDQCQPLHFGFSSQGCTACDCYGRGSVSRQCDVASGQCQCRLNVEGRQCDRCVENMYNLDAGCIECDACYSLIKKRVNDHREKLQRLRTLLQDILENPTVQNDTNFDNKLKAVMQAVKELAQSVSDSLAGDDTALVSQIQELRENLKSASDVLRDADTVLRSANATADRTTAALDRWEVVRDHAAQQLRDAMNFLETEGRTAWEQAIEAAQRYGRQSEQMTSIAAEARRLAEKHKNDSAKIEEYAKKALNTSLQAQKGAEEAIYGGEATSQEINRLTREFDAAQALLNHTETMAKEQKERADKVFKETAEILSTVDSLKLPEVDTKKISTDSAEISQDARATREEAEKLAAQNKPIVDESEKVKSEAEMELKKAEAQVQLASDMLASVDAARVRARNAVELAENTLKEANNTLRTLEEFDDLVQRSKAEAVEAWKLVPETYRLIEDAENRTRTAEAALGNAKTGADSAADTAKQAQEVAEEASKAAMQIRQQIGSTKTVAEEMKQKAEAVKEDTTKATNTLANYKELAAEDKRKTKEALDQASQAELTANKTYASTDDAMDMLNRILDELRNLEGVSEEDLDKLEKEMARAEAILDDARLEQEVQSMKEKQLEQQKRISQFQSDIDKLRQEVDNVEKIRNSLPRQCFNIIDLEQDNSRR